ncbi:cell division protein ZipA [Aliivibrio logei]|uniref:cell division protein ZipA n=1 Tax=Aliivibrio logei TaxID=688 RepID=UPI0035C89BCE
MQELRLVLILVGALAIAALLFHGLWTSRKETNSKFGKKVDIDFDSEIDDEQPAPMRTFDQAKEDVNIPRERKEPAFAREEPAFSKDPIFDGESVTSEPIEKIQEKPVETAIEKVEQPPINDIKVEQEPTMSFSAIDENVVPQKEIPQPLQIEEPIVIPEPIITIIEEPEPEPKPEEDVIVINVHGMGSERFNGNRLFNSLEQNGLVFGDMGIYHRHSDLSGSGKVLFSTANMVAPGHFQVPEGDEFSTPGISFFLPLPCYGDAEHNFKLMLQTAQLVSSELGGNILDEKRDMLTPNKIDEYKQRAKVFCRK